MGFMFFWVLSVISSYTMELIQGMRIFKDLADVGYKMNKDKMLELSEELDLGSRKELLIPVYNFMVVFQKTIKYNTSKFMMLDKLRLLGVLEKMSEVEIEEYEKNPTLINALLLNTNSRSKKTVRLNEDEEFKEMVQLLAELKKDQEEIDELENKISKLEEKRDARKKAIENALINGEEYIAIDKGILELRDNPEMLEEKEELRSRPYYESSEIECKNKELILEEIRKYYLSREDEKCEIFEEGMSRKRTR